MRSGGLHLVSVEVSFRLARATQEDPISNKQQQQKPMKIWLLGPPLPSPSLPFSPQGFSGLALRRAKTRAYQEFRRSQWGVSQCTRGLVG